MLVILADDSKPRDPSDYDMTVCAELPDPDLNPRLHQIVKRCMLHVTWSMWYCKEGCPLYAEWFMLQTISKEIL